ncbi:hypothetical protein EYR36_003305 [Pleurotus pulmonarius]|nr:hypothetical protein EYR36_003305 [Pleurotus pulmonarius]
MPVLQPGAQLAVIANSTLAEAKSISVDATQIAKSYKEWLEQSNFQASHMEAPVQEKAMSSIRHAYGSSLSALNECSKCLHEIDIYWADHDNHLRKLSDSPSVAISVIKQEIAMWTREHEFVCQAISDITASCDALTVTPVDHSKLWKKVIAQVTGRTKVTTLPFVTGSEGQAVLVSPQQKDIREEGFELLISKHHFDVPSITQSTSQVSQCIHALYPRSGSKDPEILAEYMGTLSEARDIASAGQSFYQSALKMLEAHGEPGQEMLTHIFKIQDSIRVLLPKYTKIQEKVTKDAPARDASSHRVSAHGVQDLHNSCQETPTISRLTEALEHLIEAMSECNEFWSKISCGVDYIRTPGRDITTISSGSLRRTWRVEASHYRAYYKEITNSRSSKRLSVSAKKMFCIDATTFDDEPALSSKAFPPRKNSAAL